MITPPQKQHSTTNRQSDDNDYNFWKTHFHLHLLYCPVTYARTQCLKLLQRCRCFHWLHLVLYFSTLLIAPSPSLSPPVLSLSFLRSSKRRKWIIWAVLESLRAFPLSLTVSAVLDGLKHTRTHRKMPRTTVKKNWCKVHHSQQPLHYFLWLHPIFPSSPSILFFSLVFVLPVINLSSPGYAFLPILCPCNCKLYKQLSKLCNI